MGAMLMQFAKLSGFRVWTVCGPKNFDLAKTYEADHVRDYNDSSNTSKIRSEAEPLGAIKMCVDCIPTQETAKLLLRSVQPRCYLQLSSADTEV